MAKAVAWAAFLAALAVLAFGVRHAGLAEAAEEARGLTALDAELRHALDEGARRAGALVRRSRTDGPETLGFPVTVASSETERRYSDALAKAAALEKTDEQKGLDALLALILATSDPSEQVAAMRAAARILARRDARGPARKLLEDALLVNGASDHERDLAAEALAFYRGEPLPPRASPDLRAAFARALAAPDPDQIVHADHDRVAWRLDDGVRLCVAATEDLLRAAVPGYGLGRWEARETQGRVPPAPLPSFLLDVSDRAKGAVRDGARRLRHSALLLAAGTAIALALAGALSWSALRRRQRLEARKQAFTCAVTHELKTPIANIALYAETLREHAVADPESVPRFAAVILAEAERLRRRVQEVLDVATGRQAMPRGRFVPASVVREVCDEYRSRGAAVELSAEDAAALGAEPLFRRAIDAVLDNAVKFAPGRPVRVDLRRVNGRVVIAVDDEGPGIPVADRERVFEPFVRLGDGLTGPPGTGLGLTLVRQCVEGAGGTVAIGDARGGGARVTIELEACDG